MSTPRGFEQRSFCLLFPDPAQAAPYKKKLLAWSAEVVEPSSLLDNAVSCDLVLYDAPKAVVADSDDAALCAWFAKNLPLAAAALFHGLPITSCAFLDRCEEAEVFMAPSVRERTDFVLAGGLSDDERADMLDAARSQASSMTAQDSNGGGAGGGGNAFAAQDSFVFVPSPTQQQQQAEHEQQQQQQKKIAFADDEDDFVNVAGGQQQQQQQQQEKKIAFVSRDGAVNRAAYEDKPTIPTLIKFEMLQCCEFLKNQNKFFVIELHKRIDAADDIDDDTQQEQHVILTTYGRTDDIVENYGRIRRDDVRLYQTRSDAEKDFDRIVNEKKTVKKYLPCLLNTINVGTQQLRNAVAARAAAEQEEDEDEGDVRSAGVASSSSSSAPSPAVLELTDKLFEYAQQSLSSNILCHVTKDGVETPLGVLSLKQINKARAVLDQIAAALDTSSTNSSASAFNNNDNNAQQQATTTNIAGRADLISLNGQFFSLVPHYLGGRGSVLDKNPAAIIQSVPQIREKRELLELAEDLILASRRNQQYARNNMGAGRGGNQERLMRYWALGCDIKRVDEFSSEYGSVRAKAEARNRVPVQVGRVFKLSRPAEAVVREKLSAELSENDSSSSSSSGSGSSDAPTRHLFHGSRRERFFGILSRGLLVPGGGDKKKQSSDNKTTTTTTLPSNIARTHSAGWLGSGIYFASTACCCSRYSGARSLSSGKSETFYALLCGVHVGERPQEVFEADFTLTGPTEEGCGPAVFAPGREQTLDWRRVNGKTPFLDDEFALYSSDNHFLAYLVELTFPEGPLPPGPKEPYGKPGTLPVSTPAFSSGSSTAASASAPAPPPSFGTANVAAFAGAGNGAGEESRPQKFAMPTIKPAVAPRMKKTPLKMSDAEAAAAEAAASFSSAPPAYPTPFQHPLREVDDPVTGVAANSDSENIEILNTDRQLRRLFAASDSSSSSNDKLSDPFVGLVEVYGVQQAATFVRSGLTAAEKRTPQLLNWWYDERSPSVVPQQEFLSNWKSITGGQLDGLDWTNVFAAGGAVAAALTPQSETTGGADIDLFFYGIRSDAEAEAKVAHVVETVSKNRASNKQLDPNGRGAMRWDSDRHTFVHEGAQTLDPLVIRSKHAVTIVGAHPVRHIQIVLRMYKSPSEVLTGFDVDSCSVGLTGGDQKLKVVATRRARRAFNKRINVVDLSRRSTTYESRLAKYAKRGFAVLVPGLMIAHVAAEIRDSAPAVAKRHQQGLAKLLALDCMSDPDKSFANVRNPAAVVDPAGCGRKARRQAQLRAQSAPGTEAQQCVRSGMAGRPRSADVSGKTADPLVFPKRQASAVASDASPEFAAAVSKADEAADTETRRLGARAFTMRRFTARGKKLPRSDYSNVALPWGPAWTRQKIQNVLEGKERSNFFSQRTGENSAGKDVDSIPHEHVVFIGKESVFSGFESWCSLCCQERQRLAGGNRKKDYGSQLKSPERKMSWLRENPGSQLLTGSFHPVADDQYTAGAYDENSKNTDLSFPDIAPRRHIPSIVRGDGQPQPLSLPIVLIDEAQSKEQLAAFAEARAPQESVGIVVVCENMQLPPLLPQVAALPGMPGQQQRGFKGKKWAVKKMAPRKAMPARRSAPAVGRAPGFGGGGGGMFGAPEGAGAFGAVPPQFGGGGGLFNHQQQAAAAAGGPFGPHAAPFGVPPYFPGTAGGDLPEYMMGHPGLPHLPPGGMPPPPSSMLMPASLFGSAVPGSLAFALHATMHQAVGADRALFRSIFSGGDNGGLLPLSPLYGNRSVSNVQFERTGPAAFPAVSALPTVRIYGTRRRLLQQFSSSSSNTSNNNNSVFGENGFNSNNGLFGGGASSSSAPNDRVVIVYLREPLRRQEQHRDPNSSSGGGFFGGAPAANSGGGMFGASGPAAVEDASTVHDLAWLEKHFKPTALNSNPPSLVFVILGEESDFADFEADVGASGIADAVVYAAGAPHCTVLEPFLRTLVTQRILRHPPQDQQQLHVPLDFPHQFLQQQQQQQQETVPRFTICVDAATENADEFIKIGASWCLPVYGLKPEDAHVQQAVQFGEQQQPSWGSSCQLRKIFKLSSIPQQFPQQPHPMVTNIPAELTTLAQGCFQAQLLPLAPLKQRRDEQSFNPNTAPFGAAPGTAGPAKTSPPWKTIIVVGAPSELPIAAQYLVHSLVNDLGLPRLRPETLLDAASDVEKRQAVISLFAASDAIVFDTSSSSSSTSADLTAEPETQNALAELESSQEFGELFSVRLLKLRVVVADGLGYNVLGRVQAPDLLESSVDQTSRTASGSGFGFHQQHSSSHFSTLKPEEQQFYNFAMLFDPRMVPGACSSSGHQQLPEVHRFVQALLLCSAGRLAVPTNVAAPCEYLSFDPTPKQQPGFGPAGFGPAGGAFGPAAGPFGPGAAPAGQPPIMRGAPQQQQQQLALQWERQRQLQLQQPQQLGMPTPAAGLPGVSVQHPFSQQKQPAAGSLNLGGGNSGFGRQGAAEKIAVAPRKRSPKKKKVPLKVKKQSCGDTDSDSSNENSSNRKMLNKGKPPRKPLALGRFSLAPTAAKAPAAPAAFENDASNNNDNHKIFNEDEMDIILHFGPNDDRRVRVNHNMTIIDVISQYRKASVSASRSSVTVNKRVLDIRGTFSENNVIPGSVLCFHANGDGGGRGGPQSVFGGPAAVPKPVSFSFGGEAASKAIAAAAAAAPGPVPVNAFDEAQRQHQRQQNNKSDPPPLPQFGAPAASSGFSLAQAFGAAPAAQQQPQQPQQQQPKQPTPAAGGAFSFGGVQPAFSDGRGRGGKRRGFNFNNDDDNNNRNHAPFGGGAKQEQGVWGNNDSNKAGGGWGRPQQEQPKPAAFGGFGAAAPAAQPSPAAAFSFGGASQQASQFSGGGGGGGGGSGFGGGFGVQPQQQQQHHHQQQQNSSSSNNIIMVQLPGNAQMFSLSLPAGEVTAAQVKQRLLSHGLVQRQYQLSDAGQKNIPLGADAMSLFSGPKSSEHRQRLPGEGDVEPPVLSDNAIIEKRSAIRVTW